MSELVFTDAADAAAFAAQLDARLGYPKAGVDIGAGKHAPPVESVTVTYGQVQKHPKSALWRYPNDAKVQTEVGKGLTIPATASVQAIDATWFEAP